MTTSTKVKSQLARQWALRQLDLPADTPSADARPRLLKQLAEADFMPSEDWDGALRASGIVADRDEEGQPAPARARRAAEGELHDEVGAFADRYFVLSPQARIAQYQKLMQRCAETPEAVFRLENLSPALELPCELPPGQPREVIELLEQIRRLFVLAPQARAYRRWLFVKRCRTDVAVWRNAAIAVQRGNTGYAALEPTLIHELSTSPSREKIHRHVARRRARQRRLLWLFGTERKRIAWMAGCFLIVVLILGHLEETKRSPWRYILAPRRASKADQLKKANEEMNKFVNESLRQGKPIPEALRMLYGLPRTESPPAPPVPPQAGQDGRSRQRIRPARQRTRELIERLNLPP